MARSLLVSYCITHIYIHENIHNPLFKLSQSTVYFFYYCLSLCAFEQRIYSPFIFHFTKRIPNKEKDGEIVLKIHLSFEYYLGNHKGVEVWKEFGIFIIRLFSLNAILTLIASISICAIYLFFRFSENQLKSMLFFCRYGYSFISMYFQCIISFF